MRVAACSRDHGSSSPFPLFATIHPRIALTLPQAEPDPTLK